MKTQDCKLEEYTLENQYIKAEFINYGARIKRLFLKEKSIDVIYGCESNEDFLLDQNAYFGAVVGRYANRIANGHFTLHGTTYQLPDNNNGNCLHGGPGGFSFRYFEGKANGNTLCFQYFSAHGEEGFPGNLTFTVRYILQDASLFIEYQAHTDADTVCNFTNHSYFNLNGSGTAMDHRLMIDADFITPVNSALIPLADPMDVSDTPFDFRKETAIGQRINQPHPQLAAGGGYDHNYILNGVGYRKCASLFSEQSGVRMDVFTDRPGLQLYTANVTNNEKPFVKGGRRQTPREAVCLETQLFPDSPNRPDFPCCLLKANETLLSRTSYVFSWQ
ncbi:MAG: galactose mutarotase [Clostridiales bacterium]|nr:galactose mutarotase [Clostridiales bacterium]